MPDAAGAPRRVAMVADLLGPGGAQRQFVMLAAGLAARGWRPEALVYHGGDFFAGALAEAGVPVTRVRARCRPQLAFAVRRAIRRRRPDAAIAFLPGPGMLAELAGLPRRGFAVIASERNLDAGGGGLRRRLRYGLHRLADAVVSNSHAQRERMAELAPALAGRTHVIVNGVDLARFRPADPPPADAPPGRLRLLVLARVRPQKNPFALLEAIAIARRDRPALAVEVDWHGDLGADGAGGGSGWARGPRRRRADYRRRLEAAIAERGLGNRFRLHEASHDVLPLYHAADAVCLPSLYEGTSNVVCEAMACGTPVLAGRVSDTPRLVAEGRNGLLFDPRSPRDIAAAILRFADEPPAARRRMGAEGRRRAEAALSPESFVDAWADLVERLVRRRARGPERAGARR